MTFRSGGTCNTSRTDLAAGCCVCACAWLTYRVAFLDVVLAVCHELVRQLRDVHEAVHLGGEPKEATRRSRVRYTWISRTAVPHHHQVLFYEYKYLAGTVPTFGEDVARHLSNIYPRIITIISTSSQHTSASAFSVLVHLDLALPSLITILVTSTGQKQNKENSKLMVRHK